MNRPKYVSSDGLIIRLDSADDQTLSAYRGSGKWEPYAGGWWDYLHGTPIDDKRLGEYTQDYDDAGI